MFDTHERLRCVGMEKIPMTVEQELAAERLHRELWCGTAKALETLCTEQKQTIKRLRKKLRRAKAKG